MVISVIGLLWTGEFLPAAITTRLALNAYLCQGGERERQYFQAFLPPVSVKGVRRYLPWRGL
ncbi:hypothetical protein ATY77_05215 [Rhizobium sp. R634]|nr:hypothetical protein ATY77_05215 [Rhizobium sp. R634]